MTSSKIRGRDLDAPEMTIEIDGAERALRFDNRAYRIAEDVYENEFGKDYGIFKILEEATRPKITALMALYYGAMVSGGYTQPFNDFEKDFSALGIAGIRDVVVDNVVKSFPDASKK